MLRTSEEKAERQESLRGRNQETWDDEFLTLKECARLMKCHPGTARRIFRNEPGVELWRTPGRHRPIIRVPRAVFERVRRRAANPWS